MLGVDAPLSSFSEMLRRPWRGAPRKTTECKPHDRGPTEETSPPWDAPRPPLRYANAASSSPRRGECKLIVSGPTCSELETSDADKINAFQSEMEIAFTIELQWASKRYGTALWSFANVKRQPIHEKSRKDELMLVLLACSWIHDNCYGASNSGIQCMFGV